MKKNLILEICKYDADLVWEIDKAEYYQHIEHYMPGVDTSWLEESLAAESVSALKKLLKDLRSAACLAA